MFIYFLFVVFGCKSAWCLLLFILYIDPFPFLIQMCDFSVFLRTSIESQ